MSTAAGYTGQPLQVKITAAAVGHLAEDLDSTITLVVATLSSMRSVTLLLTKGINESLRAASPAGISSKNKVCELQTPDLNTSSRSRGLQMVM